MIIFFISIKILKDKINILYNNRSLIYRMYKHIRICETGGHNLRNIKNIGNVKNIIEGDQFKAPLELVGGEYQVKPYFDFDPVKDNDFDTEVFVMDCKQNIQLLFDLETDKDIRYVNRQYPKNDKTKYSYHFMIDNNRISYYNIPKLIKQKNMEDQFKELGYDDCVYSKNRGLYPIYSSIKKLTDKNKYLTLPPFKPENDDDITKYLVSYIEEDFKDWDLKFPKKEVEPEKTEDDTLFNKALNITKNYCDDGDLILVRKLVLECLSYSRAENYDDWIKLGMCLRNIDYRLVDVWDEFSKNGSTYKSGECESLWNKFKDNGKLTMGSLKYWAKNDNKYLYENLIEDSIYPIVDKSIRSDGAHTDVAEVMSLLFKDKIVYDTKVKSWYIVNNKTNIWEQDKEGVKVRLFISTIGCNLYIKRTQYWNNLDCEDESQAEVNKIKAKMSLKIASQLKNAGFKDSIIKELKSWCVQDNFIEQYLDCNINLFAFKNGVYDLETNEFRNIEPNDYISTTTDYDYNPNIDNLYIDKIKNFLQSTQKTDEMYQYLLDVLSCMIYGKNYNQEFYIFNGKGANGKSVLMSLLLLSFGKYGNKINATTFTKPSKGANETSEMHSCKSSRIILVEEPEETDTLITSRLKEFSGDGKIKTRGLHENAFEFDPQFGIIFFCNQIPSLSKVDNAIGRRLRLLDFPFKFCDNPKLSNEKLIDRNLNILFKDDIGYRQAFTYILLENWKNKNLYKSKLNTPEEVMKVTNDYMDDCNEVKKFINEFYDITNEKNDSISSRDLYSYFKQKTGSKMDEKSFSYNMAELGISKKKTKTCNKYIGIKEKDDEDE